MTADQIYIGIGLTLALAVGSQILASRLHVPSLIVLLPVGFVAGWLTDDINPNKLLGASFQPLVSLSVAVILYDAGLGLDLDKLRDHTRRVVVRLITLGVPITFVVAASVAAPLLAMSRRSALMLGAILLVSGPTVIGPLLDTVRPNERLRRILTWEGSLIDPVGGLLGAVVFHAVTTDTGHAAGHQIGQFVESIAIGVVGGGVGVAVLWLTLCKLRLGEILGTSVQLAAVVLVAALCDMIRPDTGLIAGIAMGIAVANIDAFDAPTRRPFFEVLVRLIIGVLFISISATVTPQSVRHLLLPTLALVAILVLAVRPVISVLSALGTDLSRGERAFIAWMDPRGIVAAATASTFSAEMVAKGIGGAEKILPSTFLVIVITVTLYGLTARPLARRLHVTRPTATRPLIVGSAPWVVELGLTLKATGIQVLLWAELERDRANIAAAGLDLAPDELIADATGKGAALEGVTMVLLLSDEDGFNALAATLVQGGDGGPVYRLASSRDAVGATPVYAGGDVLFGTALTRDLVARRHDAGARIVLGPRLDPVPPGHDLLFRIRKDGSLVPVTAETTPAAEPGDTTILLAPDRDWAAAH
ncbi:MAG TPA: cation:proton antiporter [Micromonosporaceae bacterium]